MGTRKYFNKRYSIDFLKFFVLFAIVVVIVLFGRNEPIVSAQIDVPQIVIKDGQENLLLPDSLLESIKTNFPGFRVPAASDMTGEWASEKKPGSFPFITWGDFDGDGEIDVAVILSSDTQWKLIIFHQKTKKYVPVYVRGGEIKKTGELIQIPQQICLQLVKGGEVWYPEGGDVIMEYKVQFDAIEIMVSNLGHSLFYRGNGEYRNTGSLGPIR